MPSGAARRRMAVSDSDPAGSVRASIPGPLADVVLVHRYAHVPKRLCSDTGVYRYEAVSVQVRFDILWEAVAVNGTE
ncbi:hypothetical protein GCM10023083_07010 [Streptomyces phyllanthi]